jgi:hypothetical protein
MLNEGMVTGNATARIRSLIVRQIRQLGPTTPEVLEQAVFKAITGHTHDEVDWDIPDNQAGYYTWVKSFDQLVSELVDDGYIRVEEPDKLVPAEDETRATSGPGQDRTRDRSERGPAAPG